MSDQITLKVSYDEAVMIFAALYRQTSLDHIALTEKVMDQITDCRMNNAAEKAARIARGEPA